jgi:hypothetical protein
MELANEDVFDDGPGWRWSRIEQLIKRELSPPRRTSDPLIRRGYQYLKRRMALYLNPSDEHWVREDYPDLFAAHNMWQDTMSERWIVEAGILADQTHEFLASYIASKPEVVRAYENYFFDIRDKLRSPGYIINRLIRPGVSQGTAEGEYDQMVKLAAWVGGWKLVQDTIDARHLTYESISWLKTAFVHELVKKGWLAARLIKVNNFTAPELINSVLRLAELEQTALQAKLAQKGEEVKDNELYAGLQALLNSAQTGILRPELVVGDEERALAAMEANIHGENG